MRFIASKLVLLYCVCGMASVALAQEEPAEAETPNTLARQFQEMKDKSNRYQEYKVVKEVYLDNFFNNVQDSISEVKGNLSETRAKISEQNSKLDSLRQKIDEQASKVKESEYDKTHIKAMGIDFLKENYIYLNWGIIIGLILVLAIAIYKYKESNKVAVDKRREYEEIDNELNEYKQSVRERETKLRRELQTERNKVEELYQKIASLKKS